MQRTPPPPEVPAAWAGRTRGTGFSRIGLKLTILLAVVLAVILSVFSLLVITTWQDSYIRAATADTERFSDTIRRSAQYSMLHAQTEAVHEIINAVGRQQNVEWVRVLNKEGRVSYSTNGGEIGSVLDKRAEACTLCHREDEPLERIMSSDRSRILTLNGGRRVLATINPIYNVPSCSQASCHAHPPEKQVLGVLDVAVSLDPTDRIVRKGTLTVAAFGLATIAAVGGLTAFFLQRYVGRPVGRLLQGTREIASGRFGGIIPGEGNDEIARLAASFNRMTETLQKSDEEVRRLTEGLEQRVEEKTRELRSAQMQVVRAEKLASVGQMAAGVAHELNNPLTGVLTYAHLLARRMPPGSEELADLQVIIGETNRCSKIIRDLLQFSRESRSDKRPEDLNGILRQVLALLEHQAEFHNVRVEASLGEVPRIVADSSQLKQVFMNIILNAAQAMPRGGALSISTAAREDGVVVRIGDTGEGISQENLVRIFDPFFTTKDPGKGTGLGLAVSLKLVEGHGGTIEVESEPGRGSVFTVILPADGRKPGGAA